MPFMIILKYHPVRETALCDLLHDLTFSFSSSLIVKHQGHSTLHFWLFWTFCNKVMWVVWPICGGCRCLFPQHAVLICLLHVWVPLRFSGSVLSSVSLSSLHPHHAYFHLARPPPLQSPCSYGFIDATWCIILLSYCMAWLAQNSATVASVQSVYFCNLLNWGNRNAELPFQIFSWFSWLLMVL